jgi:hypothetical protein
VSSYVFAAMGLIKYRENSLTYEELEEGDE